MIAIGPSGTFQAPQQQPVTTYWEGNGVRQAVSKQLEALIPASGSVEHPRKNKALERFRKASNCYYDLYNNGLYNRMVEFRQVFRTAPSEYRSPRRLGTFTDDLYSRVEIMMDNIIYDAAIEQGIPLE